jgi:hypothetical protein
VQSNGNEAYPVLIRGGADDIRLAGIHLNSEIGDLLTAVVTVDQIKALARIPSVRSISCARSSSIQ